MRAGVLIWPVHEDLGEHAELRAEVLDAEGTSLAQVYLIRTERTTGVESDGVRAVYRENGGAFTLEWRTFVADMSSSLSISESDLTGSPVTKVLPGVRFASLLKHAHALRISDRYLPAAGGGVIPIPASTADPTTTTRTAEVTCQLVEALAAIQDHATQVIRVPDLAATSWTQARGWLAAATLLTGGTLTQPAQQLDIGLPAGTPLPSVGARIFVPQPLTIDIGEQHLELGQYYTTVDASDVIPIDAPPAGASPDGSQSDPSDPSDSPGASGASDPSEPVWVRVLADGGQITFTRQIPTVETDDEPDQAG